MVSISVLDLAGSKFMTRSTKAVTTCRAGRVQALTVSGCQGADSRNYMSSRTEYTSWPQGCFGDGVGMVAMLNGHEDGHEMANLSFASTNGGSM